MSSRDARMRHACIRMSVRISLNHQLLPEVGATTSFHITMKKCNISTIPAIKQQFVKLNILIYAIIELQILDFSNVRKILQLHYFKT